MAILDVKNCTKRFGGLVAVRSLNMSLEPGDLYGLIGPNGAGKTTVFNLMTGVYTPDEGSIDLDGKAIHNSKPSGFSRACPSSRTSRCPATCKRSRACSTRS